MKSTTICMLSIAILMTSFNAWAQADKRVYSLRKGEAFDIIFLSTKPGTEDIQKKYFESAYPVALKSGYKSLKGFKIEETPLMGNFHPHSMILGTWPSMEVRDQFLVDIVKSVPDFHSMRREIWSSFYMTYWEVKEDTEFEVNPDKFTVVTSYWSSQTKSFNAYTKKWLTSITANGGKNILKLTNGQSPFGYDYDPDILVITEWESKEGYDAFCEKFRKNSMTGVKQIHQLIL